MPPKPCGKASARIVHAARELRRKQTPAEKKLWAALRDRRLTGLKFRRQHPFERFILDIFCAEHQLEVEVDGGIHDDPKQAEYDAERMAYLQARNIRVLRFSNEEIESD
ncbi:endonuclease domain-containing protein, partial [Candidatus Woesearchaeota archaeon]|nr:endonuclease domain-containing protein [Candidatus Woesearchaeota archaeon]